MFKKEAYSTCSERNSHREHFRRKLEKFQDHFFQFSGGNNRPSFNTQPVNIAETDEFYQVQVFAAGRLKEQFQVQIQDQILKISCEESKLEEGMNYIYQEQNLGKFERSFQLEEEVLLDHIHASFEHGVLTVILQKDLSKIQKPKEVVVS